MKALAYTIISLLFISNPSWGEGIPTCQKQTPAALQLKEADGLPEGLKLFSGKLLVARSFEYVVHDPSENSNPIFAIVRENYSEKRPNKGPQILCAEGDLEMGNRFVSTLPLIIDLRTTVDQPQHSFWILQTIYDGINWIATTRRSRLLSGKGESGKQLQSLTGAYKVIELPDRSLGLLMTKSEGSFESTLLVRYDIIQQRK